MVKVKIFKNPNDKVVNSFLRKSKGVIKHYGDPLIIEYNDKDFVDSLHTIYEIEGVITSESDKTFWFTKVLAPKTYKGIWVFLDENDKKFELKKGVVCSIDFRWAYDLIEANTEIFNGFFYKHYYTYFWYGTSDFTDGRRFENYDVEMMLKMTKCCSYD